MASVIHATGHGLSAGDAFRFGNVLPMDSGIDENTTYYVLAAGLTADAFEFSETPGGTAFVLTNAITEGTLRGPDEYAAIDDGTMTPPDPVPTPSAPTVTSANVSGIVRLRVVLNDTAEAKVRSWEIQITHKYDAAGDPDWTTPLKVTLPEGSTDFSIPALGETAYTVRVSATDVYGQASSYSSEVDHTTLAGNDGLSAALADLANDVSDGIITETKIADGAISTPKIQANAITADLLAATIVLASLIKTADSGSRIEMDTDGIRLYDASEVLLVRIPTNGDPVYVKGQVTADSLISQTAASFRTAVSFDASSVSTLQNGVSTPSNAPTVAASLDYLTLLTSPTGVSAGIGYDSGAGTFWIAADPSTGYVAHEYNATTGAYVRSIAATGSTSTITATVGATSHVSDFSEAFVGSTNSHFAVAVTIPAGLSNVHITKVAVWMAGYLGTCSTRTGVWNDVAGAGNSMGESATFTAADEGGVANGDSHLYDRSMSSPIAVSAGSTYYIGYRRMNTSDGSQHDLDTGASKTLKSGDGTTADGTGWGTYSSSEKINAYATYTYDVDSRLETSVMVGVATDGTYIYTLDQLGQVWKYDRTTLAYVAHSGVQTAITGAKTQAGMFYDATATELIITTTTGTGAGVYPKFVRVTPSTLAVSSSVYSAAAGTTFSGSTDTFRGGARLADPLNANAATYWVATTSAVYAYTFSGTTATQTSDRDFGQAATVGDGLTHDGTQFRGFDSDTPTKIHKFSAWDWTTASAIYWFCYAWYDSAGTTHETAVSPRTSLTLRRRERVQVINPTIPVGGADDPDKARVYIKPNATDPGAGNFKLQVTDALTARYLVTYDSAGAADGAGTAFPAGTPAELKSAIAGWSLKGSGIMRPPLVSGLAATSTEGEVFWDDTYRAIYEGDSVQAKPITPVGWQLFAVPQWLNPTDGTASSNLAAVSGGLGGTIIVPIVVTAPMKLDAYYFRNGDTTQTRSCEMRLYYNQKNDSNSWTYVPGSAGTDSFVASAASTRTIGLTGGAIVIPPGQYLVALRNTSTTQTWNIVRGANSTIGARTAMTKSIAALGTTLDIVTATWSGLSGSPHIGLRGQYNGNSWS